VTWPSCRGGRWAFGLLLVALALTACDRGGSAEAELREAIERTFAEDVAFQLGFTADPTVEGGPDPELRDLLVSFRVAGTRQAGGTYDAALDIGGTASLLELRGGGGDGVLLRTGFGALLGASGSPDAELDVALRDAGVDDEARRALAAGFAGDWVAITDVGAGGGGFDPDRLLAGTEVVAARDVGEVRRFDVRIDPDALLGPVLGDTVAAPLDLPETVPGVLEVRDGVVGQLRLELAEEAPGALRLGLLVVDHGDVAAPDPVEPTATLTLADLRALATALDLPLAGR
jgi:hypothetical protein